jgi:hypothetical protein
MYRQQARPLSRYFRLLARAFNFCKLDQMGKRRIEAGHRAAARRAFLAVSDQAEHVGLDLRPQSGRQRCQRVLQRLRRSDNLP